MFDGYGLALENYDLVGRWIEQEGDVRLTGEAEVEDLDGRTHRFRGAVELGRILAASATARRCFVATARELTSGLDVGHTLAEAASGAATEAFVSSGHVRKLLLDLAADESFVARRP